MFTLIIIILYSILAGGCGVYFYRYELEGTVNHAKLVQLSFLSIVIFLLPAIYACILYIAINTEHIELVESELFFLIYMNISLISIIATFAIYHLNNVFGYVTFVFVLQWSLNTYIQSQFKEAYYHIIINNRNGDVVEPIIPFPNEKRYKHVKIALLCIDKSKAISKEEQPFRSTSVIHSYIPVEGQDSIWVHFRIKSFDSKINETILKSRTQMIKYRIYNARVSPVGWIPSLEKEVRRSHEALKCDRNNIIQGEELFGQTSKVYLLDEEGISDSDSASTFLLFFMEIGILFGSLLIIGSLYIWILERYGKNNSKSISEEEIVVEEE